jgi:hypothetical protein
MTQERVQEGVPDPTHNAWKPLIDTVPVGRLDVSRLLQALETLVRNAGRLPTMARSAALRYTHRFCCQCCGDEVVMATPFRKAPKICGDCEESNALYGWCRWCDGIPEEMTIEEWRALPLAEQQRLRQERQDLLCGRK